MHYWCYQNTLKYKGDIWLCRHCFCQSAEQPISISSLFHSNSSKTKLATSADYDSVDILGNLVTLLRWATTRV